MAVTIHLHSAGSVSEIEVYGCNPTRRTVSTGITGYDAALAPAALPAPLPLALSFTYEQSVYSCNVTDDYGEYTVEVPIPDIRNTTCPIDQTLVDYVTVPVTYPTFHLGVQSIICKAVLECCPFYTHC